MVESRGLLHVNLNVSDLDRSIRFYTEALGFAVVSESKELADLGSGPEEVRQVVLTIPGSHTILALTQAASLEVGARGLNHLGLIVHSDPAVPTLAARAEALGGSVGKRGKREAGGLSEEFAYVRDPDGYAIELSTQSIVYARFRA